MGLNVHGGGPIVCGWMESLRDGLWGFRIGVPRQVGPLKGHTALPCVRTQGILYKPSNVPQCHKCAY